MRNLKNTKAITLVALIITIIVLLILAMVSISIVMNSGIIIRAENGVSRYSEEEVKERIELAYSEWQMNKYMNSNSETLIKYLEDRLKEVYGSEEGKVKVSNNLDVAVKIGKNTYNYTINETTGKVEIVSNSSVNIITFTIDGTTYTSESGMTWRQWCSNTQYNTDGYYVENSYVMKIGDVGVISGRNVEQNLADQEIEPGFNYFSGEPGGGDLVPDPDVPTRP